MVEIGGIGGIGGGASSALRLAVLTSLPDARVVRALHWLAAGACGSGVELVAVVVARAAELACVDKIGQLPNSLPILMVDPGEHRIASAEGWRSRFERAIADSLVPHRPDVVLLLGYELIAGPVLLSAWPMVNIHPAAPGGPIGTEHSVIEQLLASGAARTGVTSHVVTVELDRGPVIASVDAPIPVATRSWPRRDPRRVIAELHGDLLPPLLDETLRALARSGVRDRGSSAVASRGTR